MTANEIQAARVAKLLALSCGRVPSRGSKGSNNPKSGREAECWGVVRNADAICSEVWR
jgi:hypothetical protein